MSPLHSFAICFQKLAPVLDVNSSINFPEWGTVIP